MKFQYENRLRFVDYKNLDMLRVKVYISGPVPIPSLIMPPVKCANEYLPYLAAKRSIAEL